MKEESCTDSGLITYTCKNCGDSYSKQIPALGHKFGAYEIIKYPTADSDGIAERICSRCGLKEQHRAVLKNPSGTTSSIDSEASDIEPADSEASDVESSDSETSNIETSEPKENSSDNAGIEENETAAVEDFDDALFIVEEPDFQEERSPTESGVPSLVIIIACIFSTAVLFVIFLLGKNKQ